MSIANILTTGATGATGAAISNCRELYANSLHANSLDILNLVANTIITNSLTTQFLNITELFFAKPTNAQYEFSNASQTSVVPFNQLILSPTSGGYNTSNSTYTVPKAGVYCFMAQLQTNVKTTNNVGNTGNYSISLLLIKNGSAPPFLELVAIDQFVNDTNGSLPFYHSVCPVTYCNSFNAGDTIQFQWSSVGTSPAVTNIDLTRAGSYLLGFSL